MGWASAALSVKMSVLLYIPGLLVILFKRRGLVSTLVHVFALGATQALIGLPFLLEFPASYLKYSYELGRVFLFKWTVNWRFLGEDVFLSHAWARGLLVAHVGALVLFGLGRWCRRDGGVLAVLERGLRKPLSAPAGASVSGDCESAFVLPTWARFSLLPVLFSISYTSGCGMQMPRRCCTRPT